MRIPLFNLQGKVKVNQERLNKSIDELFNLIKLSEDNGKVIKTIVMSHAVYFELIKYVNKNKIFGYKIIKIPDVGIIWKK